MRSYSLQRDAETCTDCCVCDRILTGFRTVNGGKIQNSESNYHKDHVQEAIRSIIAACPSESISISIL